MGHWFSQIICQRSQLYHCHDVIINYQPHHENHIDNVSLLYNTITPLYICVCIDMITLNP